MGSDVQIPPSKVSNRMRRPSGEMRGAKVMPRIGRACSCANTLRAALPNTSVTMSIDFWDISASLPPFDSV
jgi:hypothetical protein